MPVRPHVLFCRTGLSAVVLLAGGCRAQESPPPPLPVAPLHWPVPPLPVWNPTAPVLEVALAAQLHPAGDPTASAPLRLQAAAGDLTLTDAAGHRVSAPQLLLHWRQQPLATPLRWRRRVLGPFASFESAEQAATVWRQLGATPVIAHPREWEVWAHSDAVAPEGVASRLEEGQQRQALGLELRRPGGSLALVAPVQITAKGGLLWKGGRYGGPFRLLPDAYGRWSLVEEVPLERYLEGVVPHEIGGGSPPAALAAQAVLARTWALRNRHRFAVDGYHLCADTQCQVYSDPRQASPAVRQAIAASRHQVLALEGQPIHAVYHASNGGVMAGFEEVWSGQALPYLRPTVDGPATLQGRLPLPLTGPGLVALLRGGGEAYGSDHPVYRWQRRLTAPQIALALGSLGKGLGQPNRLTVLSRGPSGRVLALEIGGSSGGRRVLRLDAIRRTLRTLPSTLFTLAPAGPGVWQVEGGGFGHGAGLSQAGAIDLARRGWSRDRILQHYYPGAVLKPIEGLGGPP